MTSVRARNFDILIKIPDILSSKSGFLVSDMKQASYSDNFSGLENDVLDALEGQKNTLNIVVMSQSN